MGPRRPSRSYGLRPFSSSFVFTDNQRLYRSVSQANKMKNNNSLIGSIVGFLTGGVGAIASACGLAGGTCAGACASLGGSAATTLFGLGSGATGAFLHKWQPAFIAVSVIAFGYVFYNLYFRKTKAENCSTGLSCECPPIKSSTLRFQKVFLWAALLLSLGFYGYPLFSRSAAVAGVENPGKEGRSKAPSCLTDSSKRREETCDKPCE